jgi:hypothetical protein
MAILWVYLPKYSTTDFGLPKVLAKQGLPIIFARICSVLYRTIALSFSLCPKTYLLQKKLAISSDILPLSVFVYTTTRTIQSKCDASSIAVPKYAKRLSSCLYFFGLTKVL